MMVVRVRKKRHAPYVVLDRATLRMAGLSLKARGLWAVCMSFPDDWRINVRHLITLSELDGEASVRTGLRELEGVGLACFVRVRGEDGAFNQGDWVLYETAGLAGQQDVAPDGENRNVGGTGEKRGAEIGADGTETPHGEKPHVDEPHVAEPDVDQPHVDNHHDYVLKSPRRKENEERESETEGTRTRFLGGLLGEDQDAARRHCRALFADLGAPGQADTFFDYYQARGWRIGGEPVADVAALARVWVERARQHGELVDTDGRHDPKHRDGQRSDYGLTPDELDAILASGGEEGTSS